MGSRYGDVGSWKHPLRRQGVILRSLKDFEYLGITPELVLEHADKTFWAFKDFQGQGWPWPTKPQRG